MKFLPLIAAAALSISAVPAQAGQIMPNLYADKVCQSLSYGVGWKDANAYAVREAYVHSIEDAPMTSSGYLLDRETSLAAAQKKCGALIMKAFAVHQQAQ